MTAIKYRTADIAAYERTLVSFDSAFDHFIAGDQHDGRIDLIGIALAGVAGIFAYLGGWLTPNAISHAPCFLTIQIGRCVARPQPPTRRMKP